jgi:hypothetical protein
VVIFSGETEAHMADRLAEFMGPLTKVVDNQSKN